MCKTISEKVLGRYSQKSTRFSFHYVNYYTTNFGGYLQCTNSQKSARYSICNVK